MATRQAKRLPFIYGAQYYRDPTPEPRLWADDLRLMADSGFNAVKYWAQWRWIHRKPEHMHFDELDTLMDLAAANSRVRILAIATNEEVAIARASFDLLANLERRPS